MMNSLIDSVENIVEIEENLPFTRFSSFPTIFSKFGRSQSECINFVDDELKFAKMMDSVIDRVEKIEGKG